MNSNSKEIAQHTGDHIGLKRKILMATFQFSQGDEILQRTIFQYLKALHPDWELKEADESKLFDESVELARSRFNDPRHHYHVETKEHWSGLPSEVVTFKEGLRYARVYLNGTVKERSELIPDIFRHIALKDWWFTVHKLGRGYIPDGTSHYNPYKDPWRSDLCYFGFLGHTTGLPEFDQMFAEVVRYWQLHSDKNKDADADMIRSVVDSFNSHHPTMTVTLTESKKFQ